MAPGIVSTTTYGGHTYSYMNPTDMNPTDESYSKSSSTTSTSTTEREPSEYDAFINTLLNKPHTKKKTKRKKRIKPASYRK
jgi:hypothetical protein